MRKHIKRISILILSIALISTLTSNLNNKNNEIVEIYKADQNEQYNDFYLEKGHTLTLYKDNSYKIVDENGIIVNQE